MQFLWMRLRAKKDFLHRSAIKKSAFFPKRNKKWILSLGSKKDCPWPQLYNPRHRFGLKLPLAIGHWFFLAPRRTRKIRYFFPMRKKNCMRAKNQFPRSQVHHPRHRIDFYLTCNLTDSWDFFKFSFFLLGWKRKFSS